MKRILLVVSVLGIALYGGNISSAAFAQETTATDTSSIPVPERHDPYDLSQAAEVDSNDVYASGHGTRQKRKRPALSGEMS